MDMYICLKAAGLLCIFCACVFVGMELEQRLKRRWQFWQELQETFSVLEKEMLFRHTAVADALRYAADGLDTCLGQVLDRAADQIEKGEGVTFEEIWKHAADDCIPQRFLDESEKKILYRAAASLCSSDPIMQRTLLEQNQERFEQLSEAAKQEYREKGELIRRLAAAAGIFLVILLI